MATPIRTVAAALLAGVVVGRFGPAAASGAPWAAAAVAVLATAVAGAAARAAWDSAAARPGCAPRTRLRLLGAAVVLAFLAGAVRGATPGPPDLAMPSLDVASVEGVVVSGPDPLRTGTTEDGERRSAAAVVDLGPCTARVVFDLPAGETSSDLLPGDRVRVVGRVRPRGRPSNPGERRGRAGAALDVQGASVDRRDGGALGTVDALRRAAERLRRTTAERLRRAAGGETPAYGVFLCLLTGDRSALPPAVARAFRDSGTAHLLAVSGLHLVLLAAVLSALGRRTFPERVRRRAGLPALVGAILLYTAMCRFETPVVRSAVFLVVGAVGRAARRRTSTLDHLALAAALVAGVSPDQVEDIGFQLSFAAVAGISCLARPLREALFPSLRILERFPEAMSRRRLRWTKSAAAAFATTVAAQAATSPVVAAHFGTAQPVGLLSNLVAVPLFAATLPFGLVLAAAGGAAPGATAPAADLASRIFVGVADGAAALPWGHVALGRPPPLLLAAAAALLVVGARTARGRRADLALPAAAWALTGLVPALLPRSAAAEVVALDVGHGLSVLVRAPDGGTILFDAGGRSPAVGERVIVPALRALAVGAIDVLLLSHEDSDHCGAAEDVLREVRVGRVVVPSGFGASPAGLSVLGACAAAGVPVEGALAGDAIVARGLRADVLHPPFPAVGGAENSDSLVLRAAADDGAGRTLSVLLTGDVEGAALERLAAADVLPPADVVLLPHHGRAEPDPQERLVARVRAHLAVASGSDGTSVTVRDVWVTGACGAIRVRAGRPPEAWPWEDP